MPIWSVLALLLLAVCATVILAIGELRESAERRAIGESEQAAYLLLSNFERTAEAIQSFMKELEHQIDFGAPPDVLHDLLRYKRRPSGIVQLSLVAPDGIWIASNIAAASERAVDLSDRVHIKVHMSIGDAGLPASEMYISKPLLGRVSGIYTIQFTYAIRRYDGELSGIFVASYDVSDFIDFYQKLPISRSGVVALSGMDGINRIRTARETSFGADVSGGDVFRSVLALGDAQFSGKSSLDGRHFVGFHARSHIYPFYVFVGRYSDDIRRETSRFQTVLIALGLLIASLAVAALWSGHRYAQSETMRRQSETLLSARQRESDILSTLGRVPNIYVADIAGGMGGAVNVRSAPPKGTSRPSSREAVTRHIRANAARILGRTGPGPQISYERFRHGNDDYELLIVAGEISPLPLGRETGRTIKPDYAIVAIDQSDKRTEEQKLFQLSKLAALGEMTTGLAHEINQPLTIIRMVVENALDPVGHGIADAHLAKKMQTIDAQAERMQRIIEHMRIFGTEPLGRKTVVALGDIASAAIDMVSTQYRLLNIVIDQQLDAAGTLPVSVQAIQIEQVILNVLRNARDTILERRATGQETLEGRIEVRAVVETQPPSRPGGVPLDGVSLVVSDNGTGIEPRLIDRIFEPFFTTKPPNRGTGLGLSVSHSILRDHDGSIRAENGPDGAVITIWLPIIQADQEARPEPGPGDTADNPSRRKFRARAVPCCGHRRTTRDNDDGEDHD